MLFLKALFYYSHLTKFHNIFISDEDFEKFRNKLSNLLDISKMGSNPVLVVGFKEYNVAS